MGDTGAARRPQVNETYGQDMFERVGAFLEAHQLGADPANYAFAHRVLSDPKMGEGQVAEGFRLTRRDIERMGGVVSIGAPVVRTRKPKRVSNPVDEQAAALVAQTQAQVDGFADMMRSIQDETRGFGRDLAESAQAFTRTPKLAEIDEIARITGAMIVRIRDTEQRLARATEETEGLRRKLAEARDTARRDMLTGLPNRRAFEEAFAARRTEQRPHCLALCDIDRFKRINDEHGHGVGDRVLSAIGQTLTAACDGHLVARHGGEEFAVLLHGIDLADAAALLDEARATVAAKRFRNRETDAAIGRITFSAGVTAIQPDDTAETALARADQLLYAAKADGRDRVSAA